MRKSLVTFAAAGLCAASVASLAVHASSHREAPFIAGLPTVDGTDLYMFRSYEPERLNTNWVTILANYHPLQQPYGGPNYFALDPNALYEIHIDNTGNGREDITFAFRFRHDFPQQSSVLDIGGVENEIPLIQSGPIGPGVVNATQNRVESYQVFMTRGDRRSGQRFGPLQNMGNASGGGAGSDSFRKPVDNIGNKTIEDYPTYADNHIYQMQIPGCDFPARVFVGQRQENFAVNLGEVFDLINLVPAPGVVDGRGVPGGRPNIVEEANVTTIALEVRTGCLTNGDNPIIGGWTTSSVRQARILNPEPEGPVTGEGPNARPREPAIEGGAWTQVSRLGMPLTNEVVIGLSDKDRFNASQPRNDGQFLDYVTHPTLPALIDLLFRDAVGAEDSIAPDNLPRQDLVLTFLTGIPGLNQPENVTPSEMLRLNTAIDPVPLAEQERLGVLALDLAGFPNGRRPIDDVTDAALRVVMGVLCTVDDEEVPAFAPLVAARDCGPENAPVGTAPLTDEATTSPTMNRFPYLNHPIPGSPQEAAPEIAPVNPQS